MKRGFTLIEVVVVLAVVAILGAILFPVVTKNIEDARVSKAKSDTKTIAEAMLKARKDMGFWPVFDRNSNPTSLIEGTTPDPDLSLVPPSSSGVSSWARTPAESIWWELMNGSNSYKKIDPNPHNLPCWMGPYLNKVELDPWGKPYLINSAYLEGGASPDSTRKVWVLSAGINKMVDTQFEGTSLNLGGDDIGFPIQ